MRNRPLAAIALYVRIAPACAVGLAEKYNAIAGEEQALRQNPLGAACSIAQKVFGALK